MQLRNFCSEVACRPGAGRPASAEQPAARHAVPACTIPPAFHMPFPQPPARPGTSHLHLLFSACPTRGIRWVAHSRVQHPRCRPGHTCCQAPAAHPLAHMIVALQETTTRACKHAGAHMRLPANRTSHGAPRALRGTTAAARRPGPPWPYYADSNAPLGGMFGCSILGRDCWRRHRLQVCKLSKLQAREAGTSCLGG